MSEIITRSIWCDDCADWKADLELRGYEVLDCQADKSQVGMCTVRYRRPAPSASALVAAGSTTFAAGPVAVQPTASQGAAAKAIVNIFETGEVLGLYSAVTVLSGDTGHLTYGRSQTTLGSGNLALLVQRYCDQAGARFGARLRPWLGALKERDVRLDADLKLHNVLRACADDPVMRDVQDQFFDETYWEPAARSAASLGITLPLGVAIVYDSIVHGSWGRMRDLCNEGGTVESSGQQAWLARYVATRRHWLATHTNALLRQTVYRMDSFQRLIDQALWGLPLPVVVRDKEISLATLSGQPKGCFDGPQPGTRSLGVQSPLQRGLDVRLLQLGLSDRGFDIRADGVFGSTSSSHVKAFQRDSGLPQTGVADATLLVQLAG